MELVNKLKIMKYPIVLVLALLCVAGCGKQTADKESTASTQAQTKITLTHGRYGHIERTVRFSATAMYLRKSVITMPVSGYVVEALVQCGSEVKQGQRLYTIESKERHAVGSDGSAGIGITAMADGVVLNVQQQAGNYVAEGTALCTIAESESLVFDVRVPYEQRGQVGAGDRCTLVLADGTRLDGTIRRSLGSMQTSTQTQDWIATVAPQSIPEGLHAEAMFTLRTTDRKQHLVVPESTVQSDEMLRNYWVMTLSENGTAKRVSVEVIARNATEIEIAADSLLPEDAIILTGGYGLEEGTLVTTE